MHNILYHKPQNINQLCCIIEVYYSYVLDCKCEFVYGCELQDVDDRNFHEFINVYYGIYI